MPKLPVLAQGLKLPDVSVAIRFPVKTGVRGRLIDGLTVQVCQPRLDVSLGNDHGNPFTVLPRLHAVVPARLVQLLNSVRDGEAVGINDRDDLARRRP